VVLAVPFQRRLLGVRELASYLGVSDSTVYAWRHNRMGPPSIKVGGAIRYRPEDVEAWLESRTAAPLSEPDGVIAVVDDRARRGAAPTAPSPLVRSSSERTSSTESDRPWLDSVT
jgi:excisionase family DNA binding protein